MTFDHDEISQVIAAELIKQGAVREGGGVFFEGTEAVANEGGVMVWTGPIVSAVLRHLSQASVIQPEAAR